ncbi:MAG: hypothetical protein M5R40_18365 [Anaerolineae bacterium]|nr:hypothetical protein [Anaerolineae bacterium]
MQTVTPGRCAASRREHREGVFTILAIDHRGSLRAMLPTASYDDIVRLKSDVVGRART